MVHRAAMPEPEEEPTALEDKFFDSERQHLYTFFIDDRSATSHRPVSVQLQPVTEDSLTNH